MALSAGPLSRCLLEKCRLLSNRPKCLQVTYRQLVNFQRCQQKPHFLNKKNIVIQFLKRDFRTKKQSSRRNVSSHHHLEPGHKQFSYSLMWKPFGFTLAVSGFGFAGATIWQYETLRDHAQKIRNGFESFKGEFGKEFGFRQHMNMWWQGLTPGRKVVAGIIGLNVLVFGMWRTPGLQPVMMKYFCSSPVSGSRCWSMLLSTFSHYSFFHLLCNMYVLWSFSEVITNLLGKEQFAAFYVSAGLVAALASYGVKIAKMSLAPSLGASGAIIAVLGATCIEYPNAQLSIALIGEIYPHSFSADKAMKALIAFDTVGLLMGWKVFDHAAHLGGILFGIWYMKYGKDWIWKNREPFMKWWHEIRGKTE